MGSAHSNLQERLAQACSLTLVYCSDFRNSIEDGFIRKIREIYGKSVTFDQVVVPGSCACLARDLQGTHARVMLENIETLIALHGPERIVLVVHTECGWYATQGITFVDASRERAALIADAHIASEVLRDRFSNVAVDALIAYIHGDAQVERLERIELNALTPPRQYPPVQVRV